MKTCHYCKKELGSGSAKHHIRYDPEETVDICRSCHYKITSMVKHHRDQGTYLCINCGRHYTGNDDKICWYCKNPDERDWFGLTSKDKTKPIFRYNYHWLKTNWM